MTQKIAGAAFSAAIMQKLGPDVSVVKSNGHFLHLSMAFYIFCSESLVYLIKNKTVCCKTQGIIKYTSGVFVF